MLTQLFIQNYAIIDRLELSFGKGLTTLTGETGAGKSILLGALSLVLGKRADTDVLYDTSVKCVVEARFDIAGYPLQPFFHEHELDFDAHTSVRREITPQGKSRAFINDTPVTLSVLKAFASQVIDLHQQQETQELATDQFQRMVVDAVTGVAPEAQALQASFTTYQKAYKALELLKEEDRHAQRDIDYYTFQWQELHDAQLQQEDEQDRLEEELNILTHAETIKQSLTDALRTVEGDQFALLDQLRSVIQCLRQAAKYQEESAALQQRVESILIELQDVTREMEHLQQEVTFDEERIITVQDRINLLNRLQQKHDVQTVADLMRVEAALSQKISGSVDRTLAIDKQEKAMSELRNLLLAKATTISAMRRQGADKFAGQVNALLPAVGLPAARLEVHIETNPDLLTAHGIDSIELRFSANKGAPLQPLSRVASGGELSRVMLVIKSLIAASAQLPTLIFDEIDTGISGEVALQVGQLLQTLAGHHQVLVITHLPQIAAKGGAHFFVYKQEENGHTRTRVKALTSDERIMAIARMIGGDQPSDIALAGARELLGNV